MVCNMKRALLFGAAVWMQGCSKPTSEVDAQATAVAPSCAVERRTGPPPELPHFSAGDPHNVLRLMVWRTQSPKGVEVRNADGSSTITYPRYAAKPKPGRSFPGVQYAYVRAFSFLTTAERGIYEEWAANGCESQVLTADGRLCPSVAFDGPRLSSQQVEALLRLTATKRTGIKYKCGFDPHHAFVFYDEQDRPVSDVRVCFDCGEWSLRNGPKDFMPDEVYSSLAKLCRELELDRCPKGSTAHEQQLLTSAYYQKLNSRTEEEKSTPASPLPSEVLGIPKETALSALTDVQKAQLCAWRYLEVTPREGVRTNSGRSLWVRGYEECIERFPHCDVPLGEVELADFRRKPWNSGGSDFVAGAACVEYWAFGEHAGCHWGIDRE